VAILPSYASNNVSKEEQKPSQLHGVIPISVLADFLNSIPAQAAAETAP
jgi:hypothetical protein